MKQMNADEWRAIWRAYLADGEQQLEPQSVPPVIKRGLADANAGRITKRKLRSDVLIPCECGDCRGTESPILVSCVCDLCVGMRDHRDPNAL